MKCKLCQRELNNPQDFWSKDCGGDCLKCIMSIEQPELVDGLSAMMYPKDVSSEAVDNGVSAIFRKCEELGLGEVQEANWREWPLRAVVGHILWAEKEREAGRPAERR